MSFAEQQKVDRYRRAENNLQFGKFGREIIYASIILMAAGAVAYFYHSGIDVQSLAHQALVGIEHVAEMVSNASNGGLTQMAIDQLGLPDGYGIEFFTNPKMAMFSNQVGSSLPQDNFISEAVRGAAGNVLP